MKKKIVMGVVAALLVSVAGVSMAQTAQEACQDAHAACIQKAGANIRVCDRAYTFCMNVANCD